MSDGPEGASRGQGFVVVGGGTTGWLAAVSLLRRYPPDEHPDKPVHLVESPDVPTIGVGEGTFPVFNRILDLLGLDQDEDWMPRCEATYKTGIRFVGWGHTPSYFHPFHFDYRVDTRPYSNRESLQPNQSDNRSVVPCSFLTGASRPVLSDFLDTSSSELPGDGETGIDGDSYHFDSHLLAEYLKGRALEMGLRYHLGHVTEVKRNADGSIDRLLLRDGVQLSAEYFFDCTGFHGVLASETLSIPYVSWKRSLMCDRALATKINHPGAGRCRHRVYTTSTTRSAGWIWQIPLHRQDGCGYVYSSDFISDDEALREFQGFVRDTYGVSQPEEKIARVRFRPGRRSESWQHNCVSFGLANNFIEPLEATSIAMTGGSIFKFLFAYLEIQRGGDSERVRRQYNQWSREYYDSTADFIVAHFHTAAREDTPFWQANHHDIAISPDLERRLNGWKSRREIPTEGLFLADSWFAVLLGQGYAV